MSCQAKTTKSPLVVFAILCLLFATDVVAQPSRFTYDLPGDLLSTFGTNFLAPIITGEPQSALLYSNSPVTLSVVASGAGLSYQWYSNGVIVNGATNDSLVMTNAFGNNLTNFTVIITNITGAVTSTPAAIWPDSNGNGIPDWWELKYFGNLNQTAEGDYDGDGVSNINEYKEGTIPSDASSYNPRLSVQKTGNGGVIVMPDQPYYTNGQFVTLTAIPDPSQGFLGWSGSATGTKPSIALVMNNHKTVTASFGIPLPIALDNTNIVWTTGGDAAWFGQTQVTEDGTNAAQSGLISASQQSWLQSVVNISQPTQLGFWWSASSQPPDALSFSLDGNVLGSISGEAVGWQFMGVNLTPGIHTLQWTYSKDAFDLPTGIPFSDSVWVDEVTLVANGTNCFSPPSGLVAWWPAQNSAIDVAGTNNGTLMGGVGYSAGEVAEAFSFGGVNGYVNVPSSPVFNLTNAFTIEAWIKLNNLSNYYFIVNKQPSGTAETGLSGNFEFRINPAGFMELLHQTTSGNTYSIYTSTLSISTGILHHVAGTLVNGGNVNFYLDGFPVGTSPQQGAFGFTNSQPLRIGTRADAYSYFSGLIDELSIYNRALSTSEINSIYLAGAEGKCLPPLAPIITAQPQSLTNFYQTSPQFNVTAFGGSSPLYYQWLFNSNNISSATNSTLVLTNVTHTNAGTYAVLVTNLLGSQLSSNATLVVQVPQRLSSPRLLPIGFFQLTSAYADGWPISQGGLSNFTVQVSSNLTTWTVLSNALSVTNGILMLKDTTATNKGERFYRLIGQ